MGSTGAPVRRQDHQVGFYETDDFLIRSVLQFCEPAIEGADAAVVIATPGHRAQLLAAIADRGADVDGLVASGRLVLLDAAETLARFMDGDGPDPRRFNAVVGAVIDAAAAGGRRVLAFGEMVALLWADGDVAGAIELEDLWNQLAGTRSFALLCAYPVDAFQGDTSAEQFEAVCDLHTHVIPSHSAVAVLRRHSVVGASERTVLERKQAELEDALRRLREIDDLRNRFVAMVVHDIRTPAIVVRGYLDLLAETLDDADEARVRDLLAASVDNVEQIERLADDMTTAARLESGTFVYDVRTFSLTALVHRVVEDVRAVSRRTIDTTGVGPQPPVRADERRQAQILTNLLTNAVKFSPPGSRVTVTLDRGDGEIVVRVRDEGPGLTVEERSRLFQPFVRLAAGTRVRGSGLGLSIARALVTGQGGHIWVETEQGAGATFAYTVPLA